ADGRRELRQQDLAIATTEVIPIAVTMKEAISAMRQWSTTRARRAS
ncbi:MAG: hypothetical protein K0Q72_2469, partial [Armatimonadetes bacterium]|nr:hypothetical protein [Armatimonadota bacterium]